MNDQESTENTQMIIDDQESCIDQQNKPEPPNKIIAGQNPDITRSPPSIKKTTIESYNNFSTTEVQTRL